MQSDAMDSCWALLADTTSIEFASVLSGFFWGGLEPYIPILISLDYYIYICLSMKQIS